MLKNINRNHYDKDRVENVGRKKKNKNFIGIFVFGSVCGLVLGGLITTAILSKNNEMAIKDTIRNESESDLENRNQITSTWDEMLKEEGFEITTSVVNLYYPKKWEEKVRIEHNQGDVYSVQFFVSVKEQELNIFDIVFGGEDGDTFGYVKKNNDEKIPVNIICYDLKLENNWSEEEKSEIYSMQEDVNYIIAKLQQEEKFIDLYKSK